MIAVVFIEFFIRVHKSAAVNIYDHGQFLVFRALGKVNVEQMLVFSVVRIRNIYDCVDPFGKRLFVHSLFIVSLHYGPEKFISLV